MAELTSGAIRNMYDSTDDLAGIEPVLQVLSCKKVGSAGTSNERYRLVLSDGEYFAQAMLATNQNHLVSQADQPIGKHTLIKLLTYAVNDVQGRRIVIVLTLDVLGQTDQKIGNPVAIEPTGGTGTGTNRADSAQPEQKPVVPQPARAAGGGVGGSNASKTSAAKRGGAASRAGGGRAGGSTMDAPIYPIESLSPYQNKWTIKARVVSKSEVRHYSNQRGDGKLFSVTLLDESGEIRATGFNETVDKLEPILEEGKVFRISKARVNIAKKQFSNVQNEYEIMFDKNTEVEPAEDDDAPRMKFNLVDLAQLGEHEKDATVDVLGVVQDHGQLSEITAKATQKQIKKRELTIADRSNFSCRVTLWGKSAENWNEEGPTVVALKGVKVGDFGGRTLSVGGASTVSIDPDIPEAHLLRGWWDTQGQSQSFQSHSTGGAAAGGSSSFRQDTFKTLSDVVGENLGMNEKPDFFSSRATITYIKSDPMSYPACPADKCNKKVSHEGENSWRCEKCDQSYEAPQYRYILSLAVNDFTSQIWLSGFNEIGEQLFERSANEMQAMKEDDEPQFLAVVQNSLGKMFNFNVKAKADSYGDTTRVRYQAQRMAQIDFVAAGKEMYEACMNAWS
ncbi:replication factor A subunit protein RFA1 [Sporobolomyces salmoneus]|uniref:replication factor A subunit protein RFA1 n=1 Tax=Sporobolomyces salmoneus TaxID=183962 RepID=UPI00316FFEB5